jgi:hypothetical protein
MCVNGGCVYFLNRERIYAFVYMVMVHFNLKRKASLEGLDDGDAGRG